MQPVTEITVQTETRRLTLTGRRAWAMAALIDAGERGITSLENPAPRLSHYVFTLRGDGFVIESVPENHAGCFPGGHCRYVLRSTVTEIDRKHGGGGRRRAAA